MGADTRDRVLYALVTFALVVGVAGKNPSAAQGY